ncbi:hypothetical protein HN682_05960 [Candidatus Peregrinibacteria bacterium]|nr:hypothetical protein [Candidatus Peregrinibacteria bacterium]
MKRFDYWCDFCNHKFEEIITSDMIARCPKCKDERVKRLISAPTIINTISDSKLRESLSDDFY